MLKLTMSVSKRSCSSLNVTVLNGNYSIIPFVYVILSCRTMGDIDTKTHISASFMLYQQQLSYKHTLQFTVAVWSSHCRYSFSYHHRPPESPPDETSSHDPHHHHKTWAHCYVLELCRVLGMRRYNRETFVFTDLYLHQELQCQGSKAHFCCSYQTPGSFILRDSTQPDTVEIYSNLLD